MAEKEGEGLQRLKSQVIIFGNLVAFINGIEVGRQLSKVAGIRSSQAMSQVYGTQHMELALT